MGAGVFTLSNQSIKKIQILIILKELVQVCLPQLAHH